MSLNGEVAVVVGGTAGIGRGTALRLARANASVIIVGRNAAAGAAIVEEMRTVGSGQHEFVAADAKLVRSAVDFAKWFGERHSSLSLLVLSQGIATLQGRTLTDEGIDEKLALHYYGRVAFATALLPFMRGRPGRTAVLSVLSGGVHGSYDDFAADVAVENYSLSKAANSAGMYNDIAVDVLADANKDVGFVHAAPGFVSTNWGTELPWLLRMLVRVVQPLGRTSEQAGECMFAALMRSAAAPGTFLIAGANAEDAKVTGAHAAARAVVWEHTVQVLRPLLERGGLKM